LEKFGDIELIELHEGITSILVTLRYALMTIFVITLAKWFSRAQLSLVFVSEIYHEPF
jgi:hypothetical protein